MRLKINSMSSILEKDGTSKDVMDLLCEVFNFVLAVGMKIYYKDFVRMIIIR